MASLSVFILEPVSVISNLILLRTRAANPPPCLLGLALRVKVQFGISSLKLLLSQVSLRVWMSISFTFRKRDISTSLFLQLRIFTCASLSLEELKDVVNEAIFNLWRSLQIVLQFELLCSQVDIWC